MRASSKALYSRVVALGLAGLALAAGVHVFAVPVARALGAQHREHIKLFSRVGRANAHAKEHDAVAAALKELDAREFWKSLYVNQSTADATANMQAEVRSALTGVDSVSMLAPLEAHSVGSLVEIGSRVAFTAQADRLVETLARLSSAAHLLAVRELSVSSPVVQRADANELLGVDLVVVSYLVPSQSASP